MQVINLEPDSNKIIINPAAKGYNYSWDVNSVNLNFNDDIEGIYRTLTTLDPADPASYLVFNKAFLNSLSTSQGTGIWFVDLSTIFNSGIATPQSTQINAHGTICTINYPGQIITSQKITVIASPTPTIKQNGNVVISPFNFVNGDSIDIYYSNLPGPAHSVAVNLAIGDSDNRMSIPSFTYTPGNTTLATNSGGNSNFHVIGFSLSDYESSGGGTSSVFYNATLNLTINIHYLI